MSGCVDSAELFNLLPKKSEQSIETRSNSPFYLPKCNTNYGRQNPIYKLAKIGNDLIAKNYLLVNFDIEILSAIKLI